jgi:colanic acid biosynthesis glycosyl transferase WcaI
MRVLFIAHYFQPEPNFFLGLPFAKELVRRGHEVEVLTGLPNYPGGKIYDGYRVRLLQREIMDGIVVNRMPLYPSHDQSSFRRTLCYTSLAASASIVGPWAVKRADVAYVVLGPITIGLPACVLKLLRGIPFVVNVQDLWPDSLPSTGMFENRLGLKMLNAMCNFVYKRASRIVSISPGIKQKLVERGIADSKIDVIYNWCDDAQICHPKDNDQLAELLNMTGRFNIVFAGNMGKAQALNPVLDAAQKVGNVNPKVQFLFFGGGVEVDSLKKRAETKKLANVRFLPRRPVEEIGAILQLADVLFVHLRDDPLFAITIPSKTQAYLAAGRPILIGVRGDAADLVQKAGAGLFCEPENPDSIAEVVLKLASTPKSQLNAMGESGRHFYEQELAFPIGAGKFEKIFEACMSKHATP